MTTEWFDAESGVFRLDEVVLQRESFRKIMEDQVVTNEELAEQARRVVQQLKMVHDALPDNVRDQVLDLMAEMAVLYAVEKYRDLQQLWQPRG